MKGKTKLWIVRCIGLFLLALFAVLFMVWLSSSEHNYLELGIAICFLIIEFVAFIFTVIAFIDCKCKTFKYLKNEIEVYKGFYVYYFKINGKTMRRKINIFGINVEILSCYYENDYYEVLFPCFGRRKIILNVNGVSCAQIK